MVGRADCCCGGQSSVKPEVLFELQLMKSLNFEQLQIESQRILCNFYKSSWHKDVTIWRYVDKEEVQWVTQNQNSTRRKS